MNATDVALCAAEMVGGSRAKTHGDKHACHRAIAEVWNGILRAAGKAGPKPLDAHDVATLMEGLKIARRYNGSFNVDDYVDSVGFASIACEIRYAVERMGEDDAA
jgi:hypothetical protein